MAVYQGYVVHLEPFIDDTLLSLSRQFVSSQGAVTFVDEVQDFKRDLSARRGSLIEEKAAIEKVLTPRQLPLEVSWKKAVTK